MRRRQPLHDEHHLPGRRLHRDRSHLHEFTRADGYRLGILSDEDYDPEHLLDYRRVNLGRLKQSMRQPFIVDGRNIYDPKMVERAGFHYRGMGRGYNGNSPHPG